MKDCFQTEKQSVYEHCMSVSEHLFDLIDLLNDRDSRFVWKLPKWLMENKQFVLDHLFPLEILKQYAEWHDVGKPFCRTVDADGKQHFPDHAQVSEQIWLKHGGNAQVGKLIGMDMDIHTIKAIQVPEFSSRPEAISLLLTGLAEVHSNAKMFSNSNNSFIIKWNQINKRGKAIISKLKG